jgi:hypothetical protein
MPGSSGQESDSDGRLAQESRPVPANGLFGGLKETKESSDMLEAEKEWG